MFVHKYTVWVTYVYSPVYVSAVRCSFEIVHMDGRVAMRGCFAANKTAEPKGWHHPEMKVYRRPETLSLKKNVKGLGIKRTLNQTMTSVAEYCWKRTQGQQSLGLKAFNPDSKIKRQYKCKKKKKNANDSDRELLEGVSITPMLCEISIHHLPGFSALDDTWAQEHLYLITPSWVSPLTTYQILFFKVLTLS